MSMVIDYDHFRNDSTHRGEGRGVKTEEVMKTKTWWLMGPHKPKSREKPNLLWASAVTQKVRYFLLIILVVYLWKLAY